MSKRLIMHTIDDIAQARRGISQSLRQAANLVDKKEDEIAEIQARNAIIMLERIIKEVSNGIME